jgi:8-oxo-dGTP pyrophosphatase MutT (NUDIX family)
MHATTPPWLTRALEQIVRLPILGRINFEIADQVVGSVHIQDAHWFVNSIHGLVLDNDCLHIAPTCAYDASSTLAQMASLLRNANRLGKWRDELLRVSADNGQILAMIERAAVRALGIKSFAVHLIVYAQSNQADQAQSVWVQQRAFNKANDPGMWDTCVGGLVAGDESFLLSLEREAHEEAGLDLPALIASGGANLTRNETITINRTVPEGLMIEDSISWDCVVPAQWRPKNLDGEVAKFELWSIKQLLDALENNRTTLEASLLFSQSLAKRGYIKWPLLPHGPIASPN